MDKHEIARVLDEMAVVFEIKGDNPFKIRAYENAARVVESLDDIDRKIEKGTLTEVKGIGKNLADHITELYRTGKIIEYEKVRKSIPEGVFEILSIPGLGPKKVKFLYEKLHVKDVGQLELVCRAGALRKHKGWGEKTEGKILQGIACLRKNTGKHLYSNALTAALDIFDKISKDKNVIRAEIAGSSRRKKEVIKDIDIVVSTDKPMGIMDMFTSLPEVENIEAKGDTKSTVMLKAGISADLRVVTDEEFPYALHHFTGSKEHNVAMRGRAKDMGMKMNEYGLFSVQKTCRSRASGNPVRLGDPRFRGDDKLIPCKTEADIFKKLGLEYIEPELREDMGEIKAAEEGRLPKLIEEKDIKGILHVHTNYSDGVNTIQELANFAKKMGYTYLGICDHSQTAYYAGGLKPPDLKRQWKEIDNINKKMKGFTVLKGIESDVLPDGSLDYDEDILKGFDFIIASVHSKFNMTEDEMTARIIKAVSNPHITMLGHPTGRLLLSREPYKVDMHKVIDAAASAGVAIELNANPHRLDIDWRLGPYAKSKGLKIAICPDAHTVENMLDMMFGVGSARKGWWTKEDVLNAWELDKLNKWIRNQKSDI
ncbi:MAG: histidinol-phosphatase [Deltaproteobacteria bacterium CG11_big_fil_rev_8_21_14_0_20_49_13]|nr:MAG: histidinol-phosphatase [Deltaproteobacteria bacterium CG11_big_fil_rev_8_21_14_0_20_49_13]